MITQVSATITITSASYGGGGGASSSNAVNGILGALQPIAQRAGANEAMTLQADASPSARDIRRLINKLREENPGMTRNDASKIIAARLSV